MKTERTKKKEKKKKQKEEQKEACSLKKHIHRSFDDVFRK